MCRREAGLRGQAATQTAEFSVGAAVPHPEKTGSVSVLTRYVAGVKNLPGEGPPVGGRCGDYGSAPLAYDHMELVVTFTPANELKAFLPAMRFNKDVTGPGSSERASFIVAPEGQSGLPITAITVACNPSATPNANRQGAYRVEVAGQLLGRTESLPSSIAAVDVTCPAGAGANDGSLLPPAFDNMGDDTSSSNSGGGCNVGATRSGETTYAALGGVVFGFALAARRRRSCG